MKPTISGRFCVRAVVMAAVVFLTTVFPSCRRAKADARLESIAQFADTQPEKALAALASIDYRALGTPDRHFFDFLCIKARDKAYISHSSDSLVLDVISWYETNRQYDLYPDALYYGGRVYSDLGDQPTALRYFQQALDLLPETTDKTTLRASVVSQTGRLLDNLRLHKEAIPFIRESVRMDRLLGDTLNEIYDLHLLGSTEIHEGNYNEAEKYFNLSLDINKNFSTELRTISRMYLGAVKYHTGDIEAALAFVRNVPDSLSELAQSSALAYAARIYQRAGIPDTAKYYAERLIHHPIDINKTVGYQILLSPELSGAVCQDSLLPYVREYSSLINQEWNENTNQLALHRQNSYNYELHERERLKAENSNIALKKWLALSGALTILLAFVVLIIKIRSQRKIIMLHRAIESLNSLQLGIENSARENAENKDVITPADNDRNNGIQYMNNTPQFAENAETPAMLRERLKQKLIQLYERSENVPLAHSIITSNAYNALQKIIEEGKPVNDNDPVWKELEKAVLAVSPAFISNLRILTLGKLSRIELNTALLIKCHVKPSQMTVIFGQSNGAIISRRHIMSEKIFDKKYGVKLIDGIIRLL